jgi:hypothetical protein
MRSLHATVHILITFTALTCWHPCLARCVFECLSVSYMLTLSWCVCVCASERLREQSARTSNISVEIAEGKAEAASLSLSPLLMRHRSRLHTCAFRERGDGGAGGREGPRAPPVRARAR